MRTIAVLTILLFWATENGVAQEQAVSIYVAPDGTVGGSGNGTWGWEFRCATDILVTHLGIFDNPRIGSPGLVDAHQVAIWKASDATTPVISTIVPAGTGSIAIDDFRYQEVSATMLQAETNYVIAAHFPGPGDSVVEDTNVATFTFHPLITFVNRRFTWLPPSNGFVFLDQTWPNVGTFGASFRFSTVPEPAAWPLIAMGFTGLWGYRHRRRVG